MTIFISIFAINLLSFLILMAKNKTITLSFKLFLQSSIFLLTSIFLFSLKSWVGYLLIFVNLIILFGTYWFSRYTEYKFMEKDIISFSFIKNKIKNKRLLEDKNSRKLGEIIPFDEEELSLNRAMTYQDDETATQHTIVVGDTGSGKSFLLRSLLRQDIDRNKNIILANYKSDPETSNRMIQYAKDHGYKVYIMNDGMPDFNYDPMTQMNDSMRKEALMNTQNWESSYYKGQANAFFDKSLPEFTRFFNEQNMNSGYLEEYSKFIEKYQDDDGRRNAFDTINFFLNSSLGIMFKDKMDKTLDFNKLSNSNEKYMVILSFSTNNKDLAASFTSLMLTDLLYIFQKNRTNKAPLIYADETSALKNFDLWIDVLERGRSAGLATTLSLQSLSSIKTSDTNTTESVNRLLKSLKTKIFLAGSTHAETKFINDFVYADDIDEKFDNLKTRKAKKGIKPTMYLLSSNNGITKDKQRGYVVKSYFYNVESEKKNYKDFLDYVKQQYDKIRYEPEIKVQTHPSSNLKISKKNDGESYIDNLEDDHKPDFSDLL